MKNLFVLGFGTFLSVLGETNTGTAGLLSAILRLLDLLTAGLLLLLKTGSNQSVLGLELLGTLNVIVDKSESGALSTSDRRSESEKEDGTGILHVVKLDKVCREILLGHIGQSRVLNIYNHLTTTEKRVSHQLTGSNDNFRHDYFSIFCDFVISGQSWSTATGGLSVAWIILIRNSGMVVKF